MKRALVRIKMGYRKWVKYINSPASKPTKVTTLEYILLMTVTAAIVIKFKGHIEGHFYKEKTYYQYYDRVEPNIRNHPYIED